MKGLPALALSAGLLIGTGTAMAANELMTSIPSDSVTVTNWYKQNIYDPQNNKIGEVTDVLVSPDGKVTSLIVGVGGVIGSAKDVAVDPSAVKRTTKNDSIYLTMNTTKDALQSAPGFKYDRQTTTWVPDSAKRNMSH